jgi:hypothetical protein
VYFLKQKQLPGRILDLSRQMAQPLLLADVFRIVLSASPSTLRSISGAMTDMLPTVLIGISG